MSSVPTLIYTEKAVVFTTSQAPVDPYLIEQINQRFAETDTDALILGQGPMLSLGFIDPRDFTVICPNNSSFAVKADSFREIGDPDYSLFSACSADYLQRLKNANKSISLALDIVMPCVEKGSADITDAWVDSLLLDAKHGNRSVKKDVFRKFVGAIAHYDSEIGNYSRKTLLKRLPEFLAKSVEYMSYHETENSKTIDFVKLSTIRGEYMMEKESSEYQPLVSIVVRTCGRPGSLQSTLNSLRYQAYKNFEVIVVEDGPPVSENMVNKEFPDLNIRYYSTEKNIGRAAAANYGFEKANGEWVNMLDDDDYLYPEHLRTGLCAAEKNGSDMVFLKSVALYQKVLSAEPYEYEIVQMHYMNFPRIDPFTMSSSCKTPNNGVMFKKELLSECGMMNTELGANEDWELWLRFMSKAHYTVVDYATCVFVNPADEVEQKKREESYKPWRGKQFDNIGIKFLTTPSVLGQYYKGMADDFDALDKAGELEKNLKDVCSYYFMYSTDQLNDEYVKFIEALNSSETKEYSGKQFNQWYCSVCHNLLGMNGESRSNEILRMRTQLFIKSIET